jgi:hypothetical protein
VSEPSWPAWATEQVEIVEPDAAWPARARALISELKTSNQLKHSERQ